MPKQMKPKAEKKSADQLEDAQECGSKVEAPPPSEEASDALVPPGYVVLNFAEEKKRRFAAFIAYRLRAIHEELCVAQMKAWQEKHRDEPFPPEMYKW
jgi:hypothetical protein